jgi:hypothetical protein
VAGEPREVFPCCLRALSAVRSVGRASTARSSPTDRQASASLGPPPLGASRSSRGSLSALPGSGKSYSMMGTGGVLDERVPLEQHGLIPRISNALFDGIKSRLRDEGMLRRGDDDDSPSSQYSVEISHMEIYNESVFDLLSERSRVRKQLRVREHPRTGAYVDGLSVVPVESYDEIAQLLEYGGGSRTIAATSMNSLSSRSHTIFTLLFRQRTADTARKVVTEKVSRIHLVDLAGSERVYNTGASGLRLREANAINKSLATLADVINALSEPASASGGRRLSQPHVPYRLVPYLSWLSCVCDRLDSSERFAGLVLACCRPGVGSF